MENKNKVACDFFFNCYIIRVYQVCHSALPFTFWFSCIITVGAKGDFKLKLCNLFSFDFKTEIASFQTEIVIIKTETASFLFDLLLVFDFRNRIILFTV